MANKPITREQIDFFKYRQPEDFIKTSNGVNRKELRKISKLRKKKTSRK